MTNLTREEKEKALSMAEKMADDFDAGRAHQFSQKHTDKSWYNDFKLLYAMITDPNFKMSPATWALIAGALAYVIMPIDIIPDFIPVVGWLDDAAVLAATIAKLSGEISRFKLQNQQDV